MARDLFDLAMVVEREPDALAAASPYLQRNAGAFVSQIQAAPPIMREQFERIQRLDFQRSFDACVALASDFLSAFVEDKPG